MTISFSFMKLRHMFGMISNQYEIFYSIVVSDSIQVVDSFSRQKIATNAFFHNKSVFKNISLISKWVVPAKDYNITTSMFTPATFPSRVFVPWFKTSLGLHYLYYTPSEINFQMANKA